AAHGLVGLRHDFIGVVQARIIGHVLDRVPGFFALVHRIFGLVDRLLGVTHSVRSGAEFLLGLGQLLIADQLVGVAHRVLGIAEQRLGIVQAGVVDKFLGVLVVLFHVVDDLFRLLDLVDGLISQLLGLLELVQGQDSLGVMKGLFRLLE